MTNGTVEIQIAPEDLARRAVAGDRGALEDLIRAIQGDVYSLALRMLCNREDAEDATQEILVRIITHLSQFGFRPLGEQATVVAMRASTVLAAVSTRA